MEGTFALVKNGKGNNVSVMSKVSSENYIIKEINRKLGQQDKLEGLRLLEEFLKNCSDLSFSTNCLKWLQCCCVIDKNYNNTFQKSLKIFSNLIEMSLKFPELGRPIANSVITRFMEVFLKRLNKLEAGWNALEVLMASYSAPLANYKDNLEAIMNEKLKTPFIMPDFQARSFALIPSAGGAGVNAVTYRNNWSNLFDRLMGTCHQIFSLLFKEVTEFQTYDVEPDASLVLSETTAAEDLLTYLSNACKIIQCMLLGKFPAAKIIPADDVLRLVSRGLAISYGSLGGHQLARTADLRNVLLPIHIAMIKTLTALVVSCGRALLPKAVSISKLIGQSLLISTESLDLRVHIYSCLTNWMSSVQGGSCVQQIAKPLINLLCDDIDDSSPIVVLRDGKQGNFEPLRNRLELRDDKETRCFAALKTLDTVISTSGYLLLPLQHKVLQTTTIKMATNVLRQTRDAITVYRTSARCRGALYGALTALCLEPCPTWPPPTQYALQLLRGGQNDRDPSVAMICSTGIAVLDRIIHPEFSIAAFPVDYMAVVEEIKRSEVAIASTKLAPQAKTESLGNVFRKVDVKLVSKSSSPWESIEFKRNMAEKESFNHEGTKGENFLTSKKNDFINTDLSQVCVENSEPASLSDGKSEVQSIEVEIVEPTIINYKTNLMDTSDWNTEKSHGKRECLTVVSDSSSDIEVLNTNKRQKVEEMDKFEKNNTSPVLESITISPPPQSTSIISEEIRTPSPKLVSEVKQYNLRSRTPKHVLEIDIDSPMELRSGVILGSQSSSPHSANERRSEPENEIEDESGSEVLFDDTVRPDYK